VPEPALSIGLPVYNGERYLRQAIDSILTQDFTDFELIISDNASTDKTAAICVEYAKRDSRVHFHGSVENRGAVWNHRRVVELARGRYFKWSAHDDECAPQMLARCLDVILSAPPEVVLVYPQAQLIDENGQPTSVYKTSIASQDNLPHRRLACVIANVVLGTPMYGIARIDALRKTRLIDVFPTSDYVFLAEMSLLGQVWELPEPLLRKRLHPERATEAHKDSAAMLNWLDPRGVTSGTALSVGDRIDLECWRSVWRLPLRFRDRLRCSWTILSDSPTQKARRKRWANRLKRLIGFSPRIATQS